jgi:hypothetical protein
VLYLWRGSGSAEFSLLHELSSEYVDGLMFNASQLLAARGNVQAAGLVATLNFSLSEGTNNFNDEFHVLHASVPLVQYEYIRNAVSNPDSKQEYKQIFSDMASVVSEIGPYIRFVVCYLDQSQAPVNWRQDLNNTISVLSSNQALFTFKDSRKLIHEGLNFRSKTEIKVYNALVKKGLLVFPLPLAVMGQSRQYKEPDFVVCYNGQVGILEIHGNKWHPPETAAKEHERRRQFLGLGIGVYEIFAAERCWNEPEKVVDEFLEAFR